MFCLSFRRVFPLVFIATFITLCSFLIFNITRSNIQHKPLGSSVGSGFKAALFRSLNGIAVGQEVRHIGFVKVHKAASSTMQNLFFRFGIRRNLTFVFTTNPNYFSKKYNSSYPVVKPTKRDTHDILCVHGIFNEDLYAEVLPEDSVYIGIVRDPIETFISAVNYYSQPSQLLPYLQKIPGNKLHNLIEQADMYEEDFFSYTKNVMARDFGFRNTTDPVLVQKRLTELDQKFRLVLISEYFDESLVLMRRYLHWNIKDILYIANNVFSSKKWTISTLNETHVNTLKHRNSLDFEVYNFFYKRFWEMFRGEGDDIHSEVLRFKEILRMVKPFCNRVSNATNTPMHTKDHVPNKGLAFNKSHVSDRLVIDTSRWNDAFEIRTLDCKLMTKDELTFIQLLRRLQGSVINETLY